jgi:hypothetical protein
MKNSVLILLILMGSALKGNAQKPEIIVSDKTGWHKIGEMSVDFRTDHDEMSVMGADRFSTLIYKVRDAAITLSDFKIEYEGGEVQDIKIGKTVQAAGQSEVIDLKGTERSIKKITLVYRTIPNYKDKPAKVEIWGLKTNSAK